MSDQSFFRWFVDTGVYIEWHKFIGKLGWVLLLLFGRSTMRDKDNKRSSEKNQSFHAKSWNKVYKLIEMKSKMVVCKMKPSDRQHRAHTRTLTNLFICLLACQTVIVLYIFWWCDVMWWDVMCVCACSICHCPSMYYKWFSINNECHSLKNSEISLFCSFVVVVVDVLFFPSFSPSLDRC